MTKEKDIIQRTRTVTEGAEEHCWLRDAERLPPPRTYCQGDVDVCRSAEVTPFHEFK